MSQVADDGKLPIAIYRDPDAGVYELAIEGKAPMVSCCARPGCSEFTGIPTRLCRRCAAELFRQRQQVSAWSS